MSRRIIEEEKSSELKTEFDKIAMPEASKRRVLKKLESQAPKSQPLPDNLVPDEKREKIKVSTAGRFVSAAAAVAMCIAGIGVMYSIDKNSKSDPTAKPSQASSARTSDTSSEQTDSSYSWGGAKLENDAALYPDEVYTNVKFNDLSLSHSDNTEKIVYDNTVRNGAVYYIMSEEFIYEPNDNDEIKTIAVYRNNDGAVKMTNELYVKDHYDVLAGFSENGAYIISKPEFEQGYTLNCYNWNMNLVLSADLSGLEHLIAGDIISNYAAVFTDGFDSMWLYNSADNEDNIIYEVIFSDSSGTGVTTQFAEHRINNLQKELGCIVPASDGTIYYYASTDIDYSKSYYATNNMTYDCEIGTLSFSEDGEVYAQQIIEDTIAPGSFYGPFGYNIIGCDKNGAAYVSIDGLENGKISIYKIKDGEKTLVKNFEDPNDSKQSVFKVTDSEFLLRTVYGEQWYPLCVEIYSIADGSLVNSFSFARNFAYAGLSVYIDNNTNKLYCQNGSLRCYVFDIYNSRPIYDTSSEQQ
ncbi:MAG: hypothetical protein ACI4JA_03070 [Oscillospiraceae bacterium]